MWRRQGRICKFYLKSNVPPHIPLGPQPSPTVAWLQSPCMHVGHLTTLPPETQMEIETSPLHFGLLPQPISDSSSAFTNVSGDSESAHSGLLSASPREYLYPQLLPLLPTSAQLFSCFETNLGLPRAMQEMQETRVWSLGWEDSLEKDMVASSGILVWRIPWTEKTWGLQSTGSQRVRDRWACMLKQTSIFFPVFSTWWLTANIAQTLSLVFLCQWKFGEFIVKERKKSLSMKGRLSRLLSLCAL